MVAAIGSRSISASWTPTEHLPEKHCRCQRLPLIDQVRNVNTPFSELALLPTKPSVGPIPLPQRPTPYAHDRSRIHSDSSALSLNSTAYDRSRTLSGSSALPKIPHAHDFSRIPSGSSALPLKATAYDRSRILCDSSALPPSPHAYDRSRIPSGSSALPTTRSQ
jgi:hypothetical protein